MAFSAFLLRMRGQLGLSANIYFSNDTKSVEDMETDGNSLLNVVRKLIAIRKSSTAFSASSGLEIVSCENGGYPLAYRRFDGADRYLIAINPGCRKTQVPIKGDMVITQNAFVEGDKVVLMGKSFCIIKE